MVARNFDGRSEETYGNNINESQRNRSVTVSNTEGYLESNKYSAYSVNSYTALKGPDGSVTIQFGGCGGNIPNCLPIMKRWNYTVRPLSPAPEN
jgi:hypothetical protein